ncbi:hypothetical protein PV761_03475 [Arthrobacter sp. CC3]|uniref:hypothetical protein n=1 Tax=Arthrobacter sp. CC3 TaxID=3029185 RepID=UPI00326384F9
MSADWWTEERRGQTIGYGIRWGNKWAHITHITDSGPGANNVSPLCGGIQGVCHINSGLDLDNQEECEDWKHQGIRFPLNCAVDVAITKPTRLASVCPKCRTSYERRTQ